MTSSVRYKFIKNMSGGILNAINFPDQTDGDDKQIKFIRHVLVAADIGPNPGQVGHGDGFILDVIPKTTNVLWFQPFIFIKKPPTPNGMNTYNECNDQVLVNPDSLEMSFGVALDNTLRIIDSHPNGSSPILAGYIITAFVILGKNQNTLDAMNS